MSLFQNISGATARDCVIDTENRSYNIYCEQRARWGSRIGKSGETIKKVQKVMGKQVELVEWSDDPKQFIMNSLNPQLITEIRMSERPDGVKTATVVVDEKKKGAILGKGGRNAEKARLLAKRYFSVETIHIVASQ